MRILSKIQQNLQLDPIVYKNNFYYSESPYARIKFPEINNIDLFSIVDKPYPNSSPQTLNELKNISKSTKDRSIEDIKLIYIVDNDPLILFWELAKSLDIYFDQKLFDRMYNKSVLPMIDHLKLFYNRPRPVQLAEKLNISIDRIVTKTHQTPSYPSGHTMYGALASEILIDAYPQHKTKLDDLTKRIGYARVLQGVHYPSDNTAGIKIIKTIFPYLKRYYTQENDL